MQKAIEKIKLMKDIEIVARDAATEELKATDDPVAIAGLVVEYGAHCAAAGAFLAPWKLSRKSKGYGMNGIATERARSLGLLGSKPVNLIMPFGIA
jgi:hypothetical protein